MHMSILYVDRIPVWRAEHAVLFEVSCCVLRRLARTLFLCDGPRCSITQTAVSTSADSGSFLACLPPP